MLICDLYQEDENAALESKFTSPPPPNTRQSSGASRTETKKLHRICEGVRAKHFLAAIEFNKDEVYQRCIYWKCPGDLYAADVIYHGNCLHKYLLSFDI